MDEMLDAAERRWLEFWVEGPTKTSWSEAPVTVGSSAPDLTLQDEEGNDVRLSSLWQDRPALIVFWRQFGCGCGIDRAARFVEEYDDYVAAGANVVIVGQGEPERSAAYKEEYKIPSRILSDVGEKAYRAYGLRDATVDQVLFDAPEDFWPHSKEVGEAFIANRKEMGRRLVDNPWLLPGEFVVDTAGKIALDYRWQYCEDFPEPRVLTTAIKLASLT
jgi:peroxiredoxin